MNETIISKGDTFQIVDTIPKDYKIWNIGSNMDDGYLPLCKTIGEYDVDTKSLKAIKTKHAQAIMYLSTQGLNTIEKNAKIPYC